MMIIPLITPLIIPIPITSTGGILSELQKHEIKAKIPNIIHFIWAGGNVPMPPDEMKVVINWAKNNPAWNVYLWVDGRNQNNPATTSTSASTSSSRSNTETLSDENLTKLITYYKTNFSSFGEELDAKLQVNVSLEKSPSLKQYDILPNLDASSSSSSTTHTKHGDISIFLKDIEELQNANIENCQDYLSCIHYEIGKFNPNYGASSDMLRYLILYIYGGAYFDADVAPGRNSLQELAQKITPNQPHFLFIDHLSQKPDKSLSEERYELDLSFFNGNGGAFSCNDSLVSTAQNPIFKYIITDILKMYNLKPIQKTQTSIQKMNDPEFMLEDLQILRAFAAKNIKELTIATTGPGAVTAAINTKEDPRITIKPLRYRSPSYGEKLFVDPLQNTGHWLGDKQPTLLDPEDIHHMIEQTAKFEIQHFGVFRFEDHIDTLKSMNLGKTDQQLIIETFDILKKILTDCTRKKEEIIIQLTGKYDTTNYADRINGMMTLSTLPENMLKQALSHLIDTKEIGKDLENLDSNAKKFYDKLEIQANKISACFAIMQHVCEAYLPDIARNPASNVSIFILLNQYLQNLHAKYEQLNTTIISKQGTLPNTNEKSPDASAQEISKPEGKQRVTEKNREKICGGKPPTEINKQKLDTSSNKCSKEKQKLLKLTERLRGAIAESRNSTAAVNAKLV